ncbi:MAG: BatA domain-containing protein [Isosphaeraceae bacterium]
MSLLAPLYALGALAVVGPLIFHLIRRTPKGEVPFSSLMFLSPTPPRLTRRSRLDQILLLILRAAALIALAFAFARPFLRESASLDLEVTTRSRVALLIDVSASMRRGTLWTEALARASAVIDALGPGDQIALLAFDDVTRPVLTFDESATLDPARRQAVARAKLRELSPSWGATRLDQALIDAVGTIDDVADASEHSGRTPRRIVLVSDLAQGARLDSLGAFEWPSDVTLEVLTVTDDGSNAGLQRAADPAGEEAAVTAAGVRVRVSNDADSRRESFALRWADGQGVESGEPVNVYVPPGESRVVRVPRPDDPTKGSALKLSGDSHDFDNTLHLMPGTREATIVLYVGNDPGDDPAGPLYFLERVFQDTPRREVRVEARRTPDVLTLDPAQPPTLAILVGETTPANARTLRGLAERGATVLHVANAAGEAGSLGILAGSGPVTLEEAPPGDALLTEIAFDHPLFAPLAGPQFNDFTKIRFWKHRRIDPDVIPEGRVLARFEGGDPALIESPIGKGRLVVLTSGWNPSESQLARSSKFVPLMAALLDPNGSAATEWSDHHVNAVVTLPTSPAALKVTKPDGDVALTAPGRPAFEETDVPGVYRVDAPGGLRSFTVNLDPSESKTSPLALETLEQFGCRLGEPGDEVAAAEERRQLRNAELEGRQKLWRWLVVATLTILTVETWLAGRLSRNRSARAETLAT